MLEPMRGDVRKLNAGFPARLLRIVIFVALWAPAVNHTTAIAEVQPKPSKLQPSLVYLRDIDPTIVQDMRYATENNFTGRRVVGYEAPECLLLKSAAAALARVQRDVKAHGMSLKVYDCYRPEHAVSAFVAWAKDPADHTASARFHPRLTKSQLLTEGYIAARSAHSRGIAVDVALVPFPAPDTEAADAGEPYAECDSQRERRGPDTALDFGTGFDCFDIRSHTDARNLTKEQTKARAELVNAMARQGFRNYRREWWHFTFATHDSGTSFDVPVIGRRQRTEH